MKPNVDEAAILAIDRPDKSLWIYYILCSLVIPPAFPIIILPMYFRYHTMRYKFTSEGISMSWGILFRRETIVNYMRIQDIHLRSNLVERWFGLARILVQTASGSASAELTLEGLKEFEAVRDFLYSKMRGVHDHAQHPAVKAIGDSTTVNMNPPQAPGELASTLREITQEMRAIRLSIEKKSGANPRGPDHV